MIRKSIRGVTLAVLVGAMGLCAQSVWAQPGGGRAPGGFGGFGGFGGMGGGLGAFGMIDLRSEQIRKDLELVPDQIEKIDAITKKYNAQAEEDRKGFDWTALRDLSQEEARKKMGEMRDRNTNRNAAMRADIEGVLLPHQVERIKKMELRQRMMFSLVNPRTAEQLKLTDDQKAKLRQMQDDAQKKIVQQAQQLMNEAFDKAVDVLTPEQRKQLEELGAEPR